VCVHSLVLAHVARSVCECVYVCHLTNGIAIIEALQIVNILEFEQSIDSQDKGFLQLEKAELN